MSNAGSVVLSVSRTAADLYWEELKGKPESFTPSSHTHDERYYTESETASLLSGKVDKETGKGLSANDYTTAEKTKLASAVTKITAQNGLSSDTTGGEATIELDSAYKSKLDGIEAGADVTDATNVAAAGAVMKSAQAAKTSSQTEAVGVDSDGKLWTASGGGGADSGAVHYTADSGKTDAQKIQARQNLSVVKTAMDSVAVAGARYFLGEQSSLTITLPTDAALGQEVLVCFSSGATACSLTCDLTGFSFAPRAYRTNLLRFTMVEIGYAALTDETCPTWTANTYYTRTGSAGSYVYTLQTEVPADWAASWTSYYKRDDVWLVETKEG